MSKPTDINLYNQIKEKLFKEIPKTSAHRSGILVRRYKELFLKKHGNFARITFVDLLNTPAICWSSACAAALKPLTLVTHNGGCTPFIPAPTRPCTTTALLCCGLAPWAGCLLEPAPACVRSVVLLRLVRQATALDFVGFSC